MARCRAWVVYRDYSRELNREVQTGFRMVAENVVEWRFQIPTGGGKSIDLVAELRMHAGENRIQIAFRREAKAGEAALEDAASVKLIVRPDVDDRGFHEKTKAYAGAESAWP